MSHVHFFARSIAGVFSRRLVLLLALMVVASAALAGCETEQKVISSSWDSLPTDSGSAPRSGANAAFSRDLPHHHNTWAVQVATFTGADRAQQADRLIKKLAGRDGLDKVWLQDRSGRSRVFVGRFKKPQSDDAQQTLEQVQQIEQGGKHLYRRAQLVALTTTGKVYSNPFNVKAYHGEYTLQIGFYTGNDRDQNAEKAAKSLRKRGVEAYYYNGPNRSLVTVGMFTQQEAFVTRRDPISPDNSYVQAYSPAVVKLQKRFPYNLDNGKTLDETVRGKNIGPQPSSLVQVP